MGALQLRVVAVLGLLVGASVESARAGVVYLSAGNPDATTIGLHWSWYETGIPVNRPDWVGFDLLRRTGCDEFVRINPTTFPRVVDQDFEGDFVDTSPLPSVTNEYYLLPVDANRNAVSLNNSECELCYSSGRDWASSPANSAPLTRGVLRDDGWALTLIPCDGSCAPSVYIEQNLEALRPYAQSQTPVVLYGNIGCGSVEGCYMQVTQFAAQPCDGPVGTRRTSWGTLKQLYR